MKADDVDANAVVAVVVVGIGVEVDDTRGGFPFELSSSIDFVRLLRTRFPLVFKFSDRVESDFKGFHFRNAEINLDKQTDCGIGSAHELKGFNKYLFSWQMGRWRIQCDRFGRNLATLGKSWAIFECSFSIWPNFEPALANLHCCGSNLSCYKWPNIERYCSHQITRAEIERERRS